MLLIKIEKAKVPFLLWRQSCIFDGIHGPLRKPLARNEQDPPCSGEDILPNQRPTYAGSCTTPPHKAVPTRRGKKYVVIIIQIVSEFDLY